MKVGLSEFPFRPCRFCGHVRFDHSMKGGCLSGDCRCTHPRQEHFAFRLRQYRGDLIAEEDPRR